MKKESVRRFQLDLSPRALAKLDEVKDAFGLTTRSEAMRYSLNLVSILVEEIKKGGAFSLQAPDSTTRLLIPLPGVTRTTRSENREEPSSLRVQKRVQGSAAVTMAAAKKVTRPSPLRMRRTQERV